MTRSQLLEAEAAPPCSPPDLAWCQNLQAEISRTSSHSVGTRETWRENDADVHKARSSMVFIMVIFSVYRYIYIYIYIYILYNCIHIYCGVFYHR